MNVGYRVDLSQTECDALGALVKVGKQPARRLNRIFILLTADAGVKPQVAMKSETGWGSLPVKLPEGYEISQRIRKRIEEIFGWTKTTGGYAKTKFRGKRRVAHGFDIAIAAYNLVRLPKLLAGAACMSATIKAANPQRIIRRKTVYNPKSELQVAGNARPDAKIGHVGFADPKNLCITTHKQAFSAAC